MNNKFQKGDIVELLGWFTWYEDRKIPLFGIVYSVYEDRKIPLFGIVYSVPRNGYQWYNVYCKDINSDHFNDDLVIVNERELR